MGNNSQEDSRSSSQVGRTLIGVLLVVLVGVSLTAGLTQSIRESAASISTTSSVLFTGKTVTVVIQNGAGTNSSEGFSPSTITVEIGVNNSVTWTNEDYAFHTATSNTNVFDSGNISPGSNYTFVFSSPGTYNYHCSYHTWMKGTVIVLAAQS